MGRQWPEWCGHAMSVADPEREWDDSTRVCVKCQEPWPCPVVTARYSQNAQQPAQLGAGAEIAAREGQAGGRETIEAQEGSGAARACACACPAQGWQAIETAPRDGTWIEACAPSGDPYHRKYNAGYVLLPEAIRWGVYHPNSRGKAEWRNQFGVRRPHHTYWRPMPDPPEVSRG